MAEALAKKEGIPIVCISRTLNVKISGKVKMLHDAGPLDFVSLIANAQCVVASSFHAQVFSLIFKKPMYMLAHKTTSERQFSLAELFDANDRIYQSYKDFEKRYDQTKDKAYQTEKYEKQKENSLQYLQDIFEKASKYKQGLDNDYPELSQDKSSCCGCYSCVLSCPKNAIYMQADEEGFLYPHINRERCVKCMKCLTVCQFKIDQKRE